MRYFYDDPLAAAWMSKHFAMKFYTLDGGPAITNYLRFCHDESDADKMNPIPDHYYIHPDSLHLLGPQVGDVAQHPMNDNYHVLAGQSCFDWFYTVNMKIIQRNGIAFMWPEKDRL